MLKRVEGRSRSLFFRKERAHQCRPKVQPKRLSLMTVQVELQNSATGKASGKNRHCCTSGHFRRNLPPGYHNCSDNLHCRKAGRSEAPRTYRLVHHCWRAKPGDCKTRHRYSDRCSESRPQACNSEESHLYRTRHNCSEWRGSKPHSIQFQSSFQ
jgi:hypothetical protein